MHCTYPDFAQLIYCSCSYARHRGQDFFVCVTKHATRTRSHQGGVFKIGGISLEGARCCHASSPVRGRCPAKKYKQTPRWSPARHNPTRTGDDLNTVTATVRYSRIFAVPCHASSPARGRCLAKKSLARYTPIRDGINPAFGNWLFHAPRSFVQQVAP